MTSPSSSPSPADQSSAPGATPPKPAAPPSEAAAPPRRRARVRNWVARVVLVLLVAVALWTSLVPSGRAFARGALLLPPLLFPGQANFGVLGGEAIRHTQLTIPSATGPVYLDVYAPIAPPPPIPGARGGLLFIPGMGDNRTIPQLINLSESVARTGEVVMEMTTPALIAYDLIPDDSDAVVQAFERLARWPGVGASRVGIVGFSGGGPLACRAAADPRIRDQVAFITMFGSYYDVRDYLGDIGRRAIMENGQLVPWQPTAVPLEVLANVLASTLPVPDGARLQSGFAFANANPLTPDEVALLSPQGQAAYHLLQGDQPARVNANIATLLPHAGDLLAALSPSSILDQITAPIYLLHDHGDSSIPFTEAQDFDAALTRLNHPHDYLLFTIFDHTQVRSGLPLGDLLDNSARLVRILDDILTVGS